jgi:thioredoxin 1
MVTWFVPMDMDEELAAIRARLRQGMAQPAASAPAAPERPVDVDDAGFEALVRRHPLVVVDCWAPWCAPCRVVGPIVDALAREMAGRVVFAKLNADLNPRVTSSFGVQGLPTLLVFKDGRLVDRLVGAMPKPQLAAHLERHLSPRRMGGTPGPRRP